MTTTPNAIITPQSVGNGVATLVSATPVTSRANRVGTSGLVQLKPQPTNGSKCYEISYKALATMVVGTLWIWLYDGTTAYLKDEIKISDTTAASNTVPSITDKKVYENFALKPNESLWISETVTNDMNVFAACSDL